MIYRGSIHRARTRAASRDVRVVAGESTHAGWWQRIGSWLRRYGVAECAGVICALAGSSAVRHLTGSNAAAAYGGAWGESIGYSAVIIVRDYAAAVRAARGAGRSVAARDVGGVATDLLSEFGPAAILDTLVVRPFTMGVGMRVLGPRGGLLAGKVAADIFFYVPVIFMYEQRRRAARRVTDNR